MVETFRAMISDSPSLPPVPGPMAGLLALGYRTRGMEEASGSAGTGSAGQLIDRYELIAPLGEGGFGVVWRARQYQPLQREVALKVIRPGLDSGEVMARFETERQALALMDHPNIAAVLDAGTTCQGKPYVVMELVPGLPVTAYCDHHHLSLRERLALFIPVCQAVQHAHQKAVLHRDLKPSNILVAEIDGKPVPKVIDFGIAKALGPAAGSLAEVHPGCTRLGTVVGTPQYMSPEQAGSGLDVDTRSDVYSLGIILCELLTGRTPLPADIQDFAAAVRLICEGEPQRPSLLAGPDQAAARRGLDPVRLARSLRGDLDRITLKALEKDRTRRYETATALARDLQRYLDGKTVSAAAPTWHYQLGKFTRRHRLALGAAALVLTAMGTGTAISLWQASRAERSRADAETNYARARGAVEKYLNSVTSHPRLQQADFRDLQKSLLETALPFYEELAQARGEDPQLRGGRAEALGRLADLYQEMDNPARAEAAYLQSFDLGHRLAREFPEDPAWAASLAMRHNNFAILKKSQGQRDQALTHYDRAVALISGLTARHPDEAEYAYRHGVFRLHRGQLLDQLGRKQEAEEAYLAVLRDQAALALKFPGDPSFLQQKGICQTALGNLYTFQLKYDEADQAYVKALSVYHEVLMARPGDQECRRVLAATYANRGETRRRAGDKTTAEECTRQALAYYQQLAAEFPTFNDYQSAVVRCQLGLSEAYAERGLKAESRSALEEALAVQQQLVTAVPHSRTYPKGLAAILTKLAEEARSRRDLSQALAWYRRSAAAWPATGSSRMICSLCLETGDYKAAAEAAQAWPESVPDGWEIREQAASILIKSVLAARRDNSFNGPARSAWEEHCLTQTVALLGQAVARGFAALDHFEAEWQQDLLLPRADFRELLASLPAPAPAGMPRQFGLDYPMGDDPGVRHWVREGLTWTETQPSGLKHVFKIAGPIMADKIPGMEIRRDGKTGLVLFVPQAGTAAPSQLLIRKADGTWGFIGTMKNIE